MIIASFDYDTGYSPAIPVLDIEIRTPNSQQGVAVTAIVDSGADATMIPMHILQRLRAKKGDPAWLRGTARERVPVDLYRVSLVIGSHRPIYLQVVGDTQGEEIILGRDILNQFVVTLNGLASVVEISD